MYQIKLDEDNNKKYKVDAISKTEVYAKESDSGFLPSFYYFVW